MEGEIDFLEMFNDELNVEEELAVQPSDSIDVPGVQMPAEPTGSSALVQVPDRVFDSIVPVSTTSKRKHLSWKANPKALSWYRHFCKAKKKVFTTESSVLEALIELQKKQKTGKNNVTFNVKRLRRRDSKSQICKRSLVLQAKLKSGSGNQHCRRFSMTDFLEVSFGEKDTKKHFHVASNIAKHFNMSAGMVNLMRTTVAASIVTKQIKVAARIFALCKAKPPTTVSVRHAWDETAQDIQVKLLGQSASRSAWKVMVQKLSILIFWEKTSISMDLDSLFQ